MKISAIISEYNPLHKGHLYHIEKTKELTDCDIIICIMSGNYVQRGMPAIIDKWNRTKAALSSGIDLVIELPVLYSLSSAEFFSFGAVSLLNSLGVVDSLCFGSESGDVDTIMAISKLLSEESLKFKEVLKNSLDTGLPYPAARSKAIQQTFIDSKIEEQDDCISEFLNLSNNILGIEYCKSLIKLNSSIKAVSLKRQGGSYNSTDLNNIFSSATSIRKFIKNQGDIDNLKTHLAPQMFDIIYELNNSGYKFVFEDMMLPYLKYKNIWNKEGLQNIPDATEGLHNKISKALLECTNYNDLLETIKSKRYTHTRLNRILTQWFVGFEKFDTPYLRTLPCPYARILGFNDAGKDVLSKIKANSSIPLYANIANNKHEVLNLDILSTHAYSLLNKNVHPKADYLISPIKASSNI